MHESSLCLLFFCSHALEVTKRDCENESPQVEVGRSSISDLPAQAWPESRGLGPAREGLGLTKSQARP